LSIDICVIKEDNSFYGGEAHPRPCLQPSTAPSPVEREKRANGSGVAQRAPLGGEPACRRRGGGPTKRNGPFWRQIEQKRGSGLAWISISAFDNRPHQGKGRRACGEEGSCRSATRCSGVRSSKNADRGQGALLTIRVDPRPSAFIRSSDGGSTPP